MSMSIIYPEAFFLVWLQSLTPPPSLPLRQHKIKGGGDFVLFESASGYALLEVVEFEEIGSSTEQMQQTVADLQRFSRLVKLKVRYAWPCASSRAPAREAACTPDRRHFDRSD